MDHAPRSNRTPQNKNSYSPFQATNAAPISGQSSFKTTTTGICSKNAPSFSLSFTAAAKRQFVIFGNTFTAIPPVTKIPPRATARTARFPASDP